MGPPDFSTPGQTAAVAWIVAALGYGTDIGFYVYTYNTVLPGPGGAKRGRKKTISGDVGVLVTLVLGAMMLVFYSVLAAQQNRDNKYNAGATAANMLIVVPQVFCFLRFSPIGYSPWGPWARLGLAVIDIGCNLVAGVLYMVQAASESAIGRGEPELLGTHASETSHS